MKRFARVCSSVLLAAAASCGRSARTGSPPPEQAQAQPLAALAEQRMVLTPTMRIRVADTSRWARELGTARQIGAVLDERVNAALRERQVGLRWILPAELQAAYERNRSYATNPYQLAVEPLRAPALVAGGRYGEPLATQLRTMIALHEDARAVFVPVELRLDGPHATLRVVLVDPRYAMAQWVGELRGDLGTRPATAALSELATQLVNLFSAP